MGAANRNLRLAGKVALITGAASGIGRATAILFAQEGARVMVADLSDAGARETVKSIAETGGEGRFVHANVSLAADAERAVCETVAAYSRLDILFNNAAINQQGAIDEMSEADWDRLFAINVKGSWLPSRYAVPVMKRQGGGVIVNAGSTAAFIGSAGYGAYHATKGAIVSLTRCMALELAPYHIRVNCTCPGFVKTSMTAALQDTGGRPLEVVHAAALADHPIGRFGEPIDVARAALFLASDESAFITGTALTVDGGLTAH